MTITAAKLLVWVGSDTQAAEAGLKRVHQSLQGYADKMSSAGKMMSLAITTPLVLAGKKAIDLARDFDLSMNVLAETSNASAEELEELRKQAMALGADLTLPGTSASDAAEAMLELSKAGLGVNQVMAASRGVLQLSAAGQLANARAAEITANALNAFNLEGEEATRVADLLAASANASSAEVEGVADSLQMASAVAATANIPIEDLVTLISEMANAGIQGSDAGTSLKQMILSLQAPSDKAAELMQELGISVYDTSGNMLSMRDLIGQFSGALGNLSEEQRNAALATIFGSDAVRAANIILMGGVDAFDNMSEAVNDEGAAAELAGARMQGLNGSIENLKSSLETAMLSAAEPFKDDISGLAESVTTLTNRFIELDPAQQETIVKFIALTAAAGPSLWVLGKLIPIVGGLTSGLFTLAGGAAATWTAWQTGLTLTTALQVGFGTLAVTLGSLALAVGAVVAVWYTWNKEIKATQEAGQAKIAEQWTSTFDKLESSGAGTVQVMEAFRSKVKAINDSMRETSAPGGFASLFIDKQEIMVGGLRELNDTLFKSSLSYTEYSDNLDRAARMAGLLIEANGNLVTETGELVEANFELGEAYFDATQAAESSTGALIDNEVMLARTMMGLDDVRLSMEGVATAEGNAQEELEDWNATAAETLVRLDEVKTPLEKLFDTLDVSIASPIKAFIDDLKWMAGGGAEVTTAFESIKKAFFEGKITPEEAQAFMEELYITSQGILAETGLESKDEAAANINDALGVPIDEARTKLDNFSSALDIMTNLSRTITINIQLTGSAEALALIESGGGGGGGSSGGGGEDYYAQPVRGRFAHGASFDVKPGYPHDSYLIGVSSGEHVEITPAGQTPPGEINILVYPTLTQDLDMYMLAREIADEIRRSKL